MYRYIITYGYKNKLYHITLTFSLEDFPHLAGFHYLHDLSFPRYNPPKIVKKILEHTITSEQIEKSLQYIDMVKPRLEALSHLKEILENTFTLFSYVPRMYPFQTMMKADYLIASHLHSTNFIFIIQNKSQNRNQTHYTCCSAFRKGERNFEANQRPRALLKKERIHILSNTSTILLDKLHANQSEECFSPLNHDH